MAVYWQSGLDLFLTVQFLLEEHFVIEKELKTLQEYVAFAMNEVDDE